MTRPERFLIAILIASALPVISSAVDQQDYDRFTARLERQFGYQGEYVLRLMAVGMENYELAVSTATRDQLTDDDVICTFHKPTGQRLTHLVCRRFRDMQADLNMSPTTANDMLASGRGHGAPMTTSPSRDVLSYPVRKRELEQYIAMLPGLPEMNRRLVAEGIATRSVPAGLPTSDELDRFVAAYAEVNRIATQYDPMIATADGSTRQRLVAESDAAMTRAISAAGLTPARYNEIVEHVSTHSELFAYVREHH